MVCDLIFKWCSGGLDLKMNLIYSILILSTVCQFTHSQNRAKNGLNLCCSSSQNQRVLQNVDCDLEKPSASGKEHQEAGVYLTIPGNLTTPNQTKPTNFQVRFKELTCSAGVMTMEVSLQLPQVSVQNITFLTSNNYLQIDQEYYHPNEFCVHKFNDQMIKMKICEPTCSPLDNAKDSSSLKSKKDSQNKPHTTTCIRKCCPSGQSLILNYAENKLKCAATDIPFTPSIYGGYNRPVSQEESQRIHFHILHSKAKEINCPQGTGRTIMTYGHEQAQIVSRVQPNTGNVCFQTHKDGRVFYRDQSWNWLPAQNYCIDALQQLRKVGGKEGTEETEFVIFTCSLPSPSPEKEKQIRDGQKLYGGIMIASSFFLLLTFIVYMLLWDQKGLHGWTTLGHSSSMFCSYLFLGAAHIMTERITDGGSVMLRTFPCAIVGVFAHFFFLSSFCWLALISFDLWWTFRSLNPKISRSRGARRFLFYVFCGWVTPSFAVIISLILDSKYGKEDCSNVITPAYGQKSCYLKKEALGEYVYYPIAGILCLNLLFFCMTIWKLYEYKKTTRIATSNLDSKRQFFKLFAKLFFVCGITWAFEVISWLHVGTDTPWYWTIIDVANIFQALEVFIIYVCKKDTIFALQRKYPCLKPLLNPFVRLFRCKKDTQDAEQSSRLNSSNSKLTRDKTITRDSALVTSTRTSGTQETDLP